MENLTKLEKQIIEFLAKQPRNKYYEVTSAIISGSNSDIETALLNLERKEIIDIYNNPSSFFSGNDFNRDIVYLQVKLIKDIEGEENSTKL